MYRLVRKLVCPVCRKDNNGIVIRCFVSAECNFDKI